MNSIDIDELFNKDFVWDNRLHFLQLLPRKSCVEFAEYCAKVAAHAAHTAYAAAYAAATTAARAAARAAAAAYAAAYAFDAADAAADAGYLSDKEKETMKQEQMNYLRELIIDSLTDEQKQNWLLVAFI